MNDAIFCQLNISAESARVPLEHRENRHSLVAVHFNQSGNAWSVLLLPWGNTTGRQLQPVQLLPAPDLRYSCLFSCYWVAAFSVYTGAKAVRSGAAGLPLLLER